MAEPSIMLSFQHTITPDPEVLAILLNCTEFATLEDGRVRVRVDQRLEAPLAERTDRLLAALGGQWDRHDNCVVLPMGVNADRLIQQLLQDGSITVRATLEMCV